MPRFCIVIWILACGVSAFAELPTEVARAQTFQTTLGFYASPAGNVAVDMENRRGWRDSSAGPSGLSSFLLVGSAAQVLIGLPEERRADRLFAQARDRRGETYQQIIRSLAEDERRQRRQQSILNLLLGAGLLTGGLIAGPAAESAPFLSALGAGALGGSLLSWILPGYYQSHSRRALTPAPSFQFGVSSLFGRGGRISAALLF